MILKNKWFYRHENVIKFNYNVEVQGYQETKETSIF